MTSKFVNIKACIVHKEWLVEVEYHLLSTCSTYSAVHESYDDLIRGAIMSVLYLRHQLEGCAHMCMLYSHIETLCLIHHLQCCAHVYVLHKDIVLRSTIIPS